MRFGIVIVWMIFASSQVLFGWGAEGHRAIATLAEELISSGTRAKVEALLKQCGEEDLASASTWADDIRPNARSDKPRPQDADSFNRQFPDNSNWHFVDLPLGTNSLVDAERFITGRSDVIDAIERCVAVLESSSSPAEEINRSDALRLLVHFVGDIHQPLHCGTGFYRISETSPPVLVTSPNEAVGLPNDRGGNDLFYGPKDELHALWDMDMVADIAGTFDFRSLAAFLRREYQRQTWQLTQGDYHHWPESWVLESVKAANQAYAGIRFNSVETMGGTNSLWIGISLPPDYEVKNRVMAAHQLTKAAVRLAQLLDKIQWP